MNLKLRGVFFPSPFTNEMFFFSTQTQIFFEKKNGRLLIRIVKINIYEKKMSEIITNSKQKNEKFWNRKKSGCISWPVEKKREPRPQARAIISFSQRSLPVAKFWQISF